VIRVNGFDASIGIGFRRLLRPAIHIFL
jgi:hypothetical protein